ncbi:MAG: hypothetical protein HY290_21140 [Planctomycetia bacterium]|nr:hypothetical protein [Planctomycetia bacterium]
MPEGQSPQSSKGPPKQARNPVEMIIVRGLIAALLVAVVIEFIGSRGHSKAAEALSNKMKEAEANPKAPEVTEADVRAVLGDKKPARSEDYSSQKAGSPTSKKLEVYSWFSFNPFRKREIFVHYARQGVKESGPPVVFYVATDQEEAAPVKQVDAPATAGGMPQGMPPMGGGPGAPAGAPGQRGPGGPQAGNTKADDTKAANSPDAAKSDEKKPDSESEKPESKPE